MNYNYGYYAGYGSHDTEDKIRENLIKQGVRLTLVMQSAGVPDDTITDVVTEYLTGEF